MANLNLSNLKTELRRRIDELVLDGESTSSDEDIKNTGASNFSDDDLDERLLNACKFIANRVRSGQLPNLQSSEDPTTGFNLDNILRIAGSRVLIEGNVARRRSFEADRQNDTRPASDSSPTYCYEDADLLLRDNAGTYSTSEGDNGFGDTTPTVGVIEPVTGVSDLTDIFENAVILYAAALCQVTLGNAELYSTLTSKALNSIRSHLRPLVRNDGS